MIIGIGFVFISIFIYLKENFCLIKEKEERVIKKITKVNKNIIYRYKILLSILSFVLGVFRLISLIIY